MEHEDDRAAPRTPESQETGAGSKSDAGEDPQLSPQPGDTDMRPPDQVKVAVAPGGDEHDTKETVQPWDKVSQRIRTLQLERADLKAKAKAAAKAMRAAQRAKRRTARNAKKLSDEELVQIVMERKVQEQVAKQVAAEAAAASKQGSASSGPPPSKTARKGKTSGHEQ